MAKAIKRSDGIKPRKTLVINDAHDAAANRQAEIARLGGGFLKATGPKGKRFQSSPMPHEKIDQPYSRFTPREKP